MRRRFKDYYEAHLIIFITYWQWHSSHSSIIMGWKNIINNKEKINGMNPETKLKKRRCCRRWEAYNILKPINVCVEKRIRSQMFVHTSLCNFLRSVFRSASAFSAASDVLLYRITCVSDRAKLACRLAISCSAFCSLYLYSDSSLFASPVNETLAMRTWKI